MARNRTQRSAKNTFTGLLLRILALLAPFIVRTIIIKKLGVDYLGINSLFSSILQVLSLAELGFSASIAFALYKPIENKDKKLINAFLKLLKKIYLIIGGVILVVGAALTPVIPFLIQGSYPSDINIYVIYIIYLANTAISYFMWAYKSVLFVADQRSDIENVVQMIGLLFMYSLQVVFLLVFANYYIYIIFMPISTLLINVVRVIYAKKRYPDYLPEGQLTKEERKGVFKNIGALFGHRLSSTIVSSTDSIFISAFLGLGPLALYQNYFFIISSLIAIISVFYQSITASIGNSIVVESVEKNYSDFKKLTFINVFIVGWMSICYVVLCQDFMRIWVGEENMLPLYIPLLLGAYFFLWKFKDILPVYKDACGMWKQDLLKPYVVSVLNIGLDFLLIYYLGMIGVIIATIFVVFVVSMPWETHVFFRDYFKRKPTEYYIRLLIYTLIVGAVGVGTYFGCLYMPSGNIWWFILKAFVCAVVPALAFLLITFKTSEFKWCLEKVKFLIHKKKSSEEKAE